MWTEFKRLSEGRSGRITTAAGVLLVLYSAIADLLRGSADVSETLESVTIVVLFGIVLLVTLWPDGESEVARLTDRYESHLSALFAVFFLSWATYLWATDSGNTLLFFVTLGGGLLNLGDLVWEWLRGDGPFVRSE